jgi:hypothetical protein
VCLGLGDGHPGSGYSKIPTKLLFVLSADLLLNLKNRLKDLLLFLADGQLYSFCPVSSYYHSSKIRQFTGLSTIIGKYKKKSTDHASDTARPTINESTIATKKAAVGKEEYEYDPL